MANTFKVYERILQLKDVIEEMGEETPLLSESKAKEIFYLLGNVKHLILGDRRKK